MFNTTEMNLMVIYNTGTRLGLMTELGHMLGYLSEEEKELYELAVGVIEKLNKMTDAEFAALDLDPFAMKVR